MLKALRSFLNELAGDEEKRRFAEDDHRLAAAALLYHVISVDGTVSEREQVRLHDLLKARYALDEEATAELMREAETADQESVDMYRFTSLLKERLDEPDREQIIAMMWDLVYQDGVVHEFEDNVVWRAAELLGISSRTRIRLKKIVQSGGSSIEDAEPAA